MRYTRNRQLAKANKDPLWMWMIEPTDKIDLQRYWMTLGLTPKLDPTFKWHREFVWEIDKYWESYITIGTYGKSDFKRIWIK